MITIIGQVLGLARVATFMGQKYRTGERIPETGIYRVTHNQHRLSHQVVMFMGQAFPRCSKCADAVFFELAYAAPDLFQSSFNPVYELPEELEANPQ